jgi:ribonuclease P protein component
MAEGPARAQRPDGPRATFRKEERLRGRLRITEVATTGLAVNAPPFRLIGKAMALPGPFPLQVAFAVPKRNLRLAVQRNRMKRLMREAFRRNKQRWHQHLHASGKQVALLVIYQGRQAIGWDETQEKITRTIDRWIQQHG